MQASQSDSTLASWNQTDVGSEQAFVNYGSEPYQSSSGDGLASFPYSIISSQNTEILNLVGCNPSRYSHYSPDEHEFYQMHGAYHHPGGVDFAATADMHYGNTSSHTDLSAAVDVCQDPILDPWAETTHERWNDAVDDVYPAIEPIQVREIVAPTPRHAVQMMLEAAPSSGRRPSVSALNPAFFDQHAWVKERRNRHSLASFHGESAYTENKYEHTSSLLEDEASEKHYQAQYQRRHDHQNAVMPWQGGAANTSANQCFSPCEHSQHYPYSSPSSVTVSPTSAPTASTSPHSQSPVAISILESKFYTILSEQCAPTTHTHTAHAKHEAGIFRGPNTGNQQGLTGRTSTESLETVCEEGSRTASVAQRRGRTRVVRNVQPIACFFCRGRKIACGPADPNSSDKTCMQCLKRHRKCVYPPESRRGRRQNEDTA
ncbi:hypothetical protein HETIRDRAFT_165304 [Heterobasidion irregulare TC 32-1]|uniref:Zn(2)-C6 fungal-type domain-containing protein n=1 Tax=Heterobasidion irregulare (strain TC 32-1) TaxID=747525 RepID=W4K9I5_HETIT|nr:uncharacterized protein HETIRDRAFT_165304 [Heterobasidion irregulare TC 32-1]ETW82497.1 hypothetical protein HETIRDRAFT_165304 [Heterobasidion irregulare TC 32-1]